MYPWEKQTLIKGKWLDGNTKSGLRRYKPATFESLDTPSLRKQAIRVLEEEGVIIVTSVLTTHSVEAAKASLENDLRKSTVHYLMNELRQTMPKKRISAHDINNGIRRMTSVQPVPPLERAPVDGVLNNCRLPLSTCAQLRRVHPGIKHVFAQLYGVPADHLFQVPDAARVVLHSWMAERSSEHFPMGASPQQIMFRKLNGTWQEPYRNDSYMGYGRELKRRLGNTLIPFGVMGLVHLASLTGEDRCRTTQTGVAMGPCFVCRPCCKYEDMRRVHTIDEMARPQQARKQSVRKFQTLSDEELEIHMDHFACIEAEPGSLILWRRDLPVAFHSGDRELARPNAHDPWSMAYAAQQISWLPRHVQMQREKKQALRLFRNKSKSLHLYEMKTLSRARVRERQASWRAQHRKKRKRDVDDSDALNDVPVQHCELLHIQEVSL